MTAVRAGVSQQKRVITPLLLSASLPESSTLVTREEAKTARPKATGPTTRIGREQGPGAAKIATSFLESSPTIISISSTLTTNSSSSSKSLFLFL